MKITTLALAAALLVFPASTPGYADEPRTEASKDILETARDAGSFSTLLTAVKTAGLVDALKGDGPFTLFAPTDDAFAALPKGTLAKLLGPASRDQLRRILTSHVVAGAVRIVDLLPTAKAGTLSGDDVPFGLRVGGATVTRADIECSNGVIHVIDAVLLPPTRDRKEDDVRIQKAVVSAIARGVPVYNGGDPEGCASIYREAADVLLRDKGLADLHRIALTDAVAAADENASEQAWTIRRVFDDVLADMAFEPRVEAPGPEGFPGPGPVGRVVSKEYPAYRAARADGRGAFWQLFSHIKKNDIAMTAPVEMTMDDDTSMRDMAFLYEQPTQGETGSRGAVAVLDLGPMKVLSIGMRGRRDAAAVARARKAIEARLDADGLRRSGPWRTLGYNSPMVPADQRYWELQAPID